MRPTLQFGPETLLAITSMARNKIQLKPGRNPLAEIPVALSVLVAAFKHV